MSWHAIWMLYRRELRAALRERAIVVNSIILPIVLYPLILWLMFSGVAYVQGLSERAVSRVALLGLPESHEALRDSLAALESVRLRPAPASAEVGATRVQQGDLDAVVEFLPPDPAAAELQDNFRVRIAYDPSEARSRTARERVEDAIVTYRDRWLVDEARGLGLGAEAFEQFRVDRQNVATGGEMGTFLLSTMVPVFLVIMVALGCFYPAIDSTAGERERSTWETLMTVAVPRAGIVTAKYLFVATLGIVAGTLNVVAMTASMGIVIAPLAAGEAESLQFTIPVTAVPVMLLGAAALALFFAAAMMILASFARTFKDGQSMVTPVYWLAILPVLLLGQSTDQRLTAELALVPVANVTQMIQDAIRGSFAWPLIAETMLVLGVLVVLCLWLARQVLQFEDHLLGTYDGSFFKFAKERLLPGRGRPAPAGGQPGGQTRGRAGAQATDQPGARVTDQPGAQATDQPGAHATDQAGAQATDQPGARVRDQGAGAQARDQGAGAQARNQTGGPP